MSREASETTACCTPNELVAVRDPLLSRSRRVRKCPAPLSECRQPLLAPSKTATRLFPPRGPPRFSITGPVELAPSDGASRRIRCAGAGLERPLAAVGQALLGLTVDPGAVLRRGASAPREDVAASPTGMRGAAVAGLRAAARGVRRGGDVAPHATKSAPTTNQRMATIKEPA
jgi:hypothetical protein